MPSSLSLLSAAFGAASAYTVTTSDRFMLKNIDPIVFPGEYSKSHMHSFFGSDAVTINTTTSAELQAGCSSTLNPNDYSVYCEFCSKPYNPTLTLIPGLQGCLHWFILAQQTTSNIRSLSIVSARTTSQLTPLRFPFLRTTGELLAARRQHHKATWRTLLVSRGSARETVASPQRTMLRSLWPHAARISRPFCFSTTALTKRLSSPPTLAPRTGTRPSSPPTAAPKA